MSGSVWVSYAMAEAELILPMTHDLWVSDREKAIDAENRLRKGNSLSKDECPSRIWAEPYDEEDEPEGLLDLFSVQGMYFVSGRAAAIMQQFDLGDGALYPVSEGAYEKDNKTPIAGDFFCWVFGNIKQGFLPDETLRKEPFGVAGIRWNFPVLPKDGEIAVSSSVMSGPDVWMDPILFKSIFLSDQLGQALADAGLDHAFRIKKCRVI